MPKCFSGNYDQPLLASTFTKHLYSVLVPKMLGIVIDRPILRSTVNIVLLAIIDVYRINQDGRGADIVYSSSIPSMNSKLEIFSLFLSSVTAGS